MTEAPDKKKLRIAGALCAGVIYGMLLRIGFEYKFLNDGWLQIVSTAFLVITPFSVGAVAVLLAAGKQPISVGKQISIASTSMLLFLFTMFILLFEGLICIILVLPVFLVAAIIGGVIAGAIHNHLRPSRATLPCFALLPLLLGPIEAHLPPATSEQQVSSVIQIQTSPEEVFDQLATVRDIAPGELGFAFVHLIGLPKPVEANMAGTGVGAVRRSDWEKNVHFEEIITTWQRPYAMHYKFHMLPGGIPRDALDRHVEMGGEYFNVLDGGFDLRARDGGTELRLSTRFQNKSQLKTYGDLWGRMVLADFHQSILGLMKNRAEQAHQGLPKQAGRLDQ